MLDVLPTSAVEVKESLHLIKDLKLLLFLDWFPEKYRENEAVTAIANTLKWAPGRKGEGGWKKGLEADFSAVEIENDNGLIGSEKEEDTSSGSFDEK